MSVVAITIYSIAFVKSTSPAEAKNISCTIISMTDLTNSHQLQQRALLSFLALGKIRDTWDGAIILSLGLDVDGAALAIAGNIAGAVSISVENDSTRLREIGRTGAVDFVVNSLDEAIRAIKNEVRQKRPLAVALGISPELAVPQMMDRGLAPSLVAGTSAMKINELPSAVASYFARFGAEFMDCEDSGNAENPGERMNSLAQLALKENSWSIMTFDFASQLELRAFDREVRDKIHLDDMVRRRWMAEAPRFFQRQRPRQRCLPLTSEQVKTARASYDSLCRKDV